ncbi:MAG: 16S rRNA (guanine(966)-N(2))-methyltransferase RsmD [Chloroflexi bacterium CG_4_10_14_0_8_um_filter_46_9]|nr:MAG: 16S rRNA (guanine(966)-N(2))-methyltransferase RsmD [Dehalococcoidia bacterium CG2_30_46_19]PIW39625.1 MAG: 16S rRNA (guanine(966)-N(2))-methyltransferase RsmD [Chloroflexi bacterium CG15_BIG_FIL_POST_REV_8_21_14_020_46_15]PIZ26667.1 MAG: 16S rRNA (guanine(966)-N(2))-methyltransferase RsmD [Chloroflexi bacterium CG_4_10_14_0_8_um_filter_46_9]
MRITGGKAKGIQLKTLQKQSLRPTTDLVRHAIFSTLQNMSHDWHRIVDLYAGTGALGIEALSRNAEWVDFVDQSKKCCDIIKHNLEKTGFSDRAHVYCCNVKKAITFLNNNYDVIFLDPPYSLSSIDNVLTTIASSELIVANSMVVLCHTKHFSPNSEYDKLHLVKQSHYGDTCVSMYRRINNGNSNISR